MTEQGSPSLEIENLTIGYETEAGVLQAVRRVSLKIGRTESFGLVGESGSGKSTLALGAIRYLAANGRILGGRVRLRGLDLLSLPMKEMRRIWGSKIGVVYQDPSTALNPSIIIGKQLSEVARLHLGMSPEKAWQRAVEMLARVAMPDPGAVAHHYPHQLSGGMLQRCIIAMALMTAPGLLIMDEPTTALDVTTQAVVLDLVADLKREFETAVLYITHDLAVVAKICDRIGVMYAGELMEQGEMRRIYKKPRHPYTLSLLGCIPHFKPKQKKRSLASIPGFIPRLDELPEGCIFGPRCRYVLDICRKSRPPLVEAEPGHLTACLRRQVLPTEIEQIRPAGEISSRISGKPEKMLKAHRVKKYYPAQKKFFTLGKGKRKTVRAVDNVSLWINKGCTLGIVGESGCGKTTLVRTIIGLVERTSGEITLRDKVLEETTAKRPRSVLKALQMVFQNPDASLNPRRTVAEAISRPMALLTGVNRKDIPALALELLEAVNLPTSYYYRLPGELSGGEKQRVAIARAFAAEPELILLDEPLSSLDVSVQASLMNLLFDLQKKSKTTYLFISHDLAAVQHLSDWIAVMYLGRIVEWGDADEVFNPPFHPYTEALLSAIPAADPDVEQKNIRLPGSVPSAMDIPPGCRFHTRCPRKIGGACETEEPPWQEGKGEHWICCHISLKDLERLQAGRTGEK